jgi:O-antigen/teichoic acid export membrane protein
MISAKLRKGIFSGFAWQGATKFVVQMTSWLATLFVARIIAPSDYGIIAAASVVVELLILVTDMGLAQGLIQKAKTTRQEEDGVFFVSLALGVTGYLLLFAAAPLVAGFYQMPVLTDLLRLTCIGVIFGSLKTVPLAIAMRRMDFRYRSLVEMGGSLMMTLTVVTLALAGYGVWSLAWGPVVSNMVMAIGFLPLLGRLPRPWFSLREVMATMSFGLKFMGSTLLYYGWSRADVIVIGKVLGERMLGYYSMAFQLAVLPLDKVATVFNQVMFPALARLQDDLQGSRELFLQMHRYLLLICYPMLFGMAAVADDAILLLLTAKWSPIVPFFQALCLVSGLRISATIMPPVLFARGKPEVVLRYNCFALAGLPLAFLIGSRYGLEGVVAGWLLAYPALFIYLGQKCMAELSMSWRQLAHSGMPAVLATVVMIGAVLAFRHAAHDLPMAWRLVGSIAVGGLAYVGVLTLLFREHITSLRSRLLLLRRGEASN